MIFDNTSGRVVFSRDDLYVRSFSDVPLPIIVICPVQWENSIHQITQVLVLMLSPVPDTVPRLYLDLHQNLQSTIYNFSKSQF